MKRGAKFLKGDKVTIINPLPPARQIDVFVGGLVDDPASADVLLRLNVKILEDLDLTTRDGRYELYIQNDPDSLRWKTVDQCFKEII